LVWRAKRVIYVRQRDLHDPAKGVRGDCLRASVASVLEMRLADVPAFQLSPDFESDWGHSLDSFLRIRNWTMWFFDWGRENAHALQVVADEFARLMPGIPAILSGPSPRFHDQFHCCAYLDGDVWDPHPSGDQISHVHDAIILANMSRRALADRLRSVGFGVPFDWSEPA